MNRGLIKVFYYVFIVFLPATIAGQDQFLIRVENTPKNLEQFAIIDYDEDFILLMADQKELSSLQKRNITFKKLITNPQNKELYLVYPMNDNRESIVYNPSVFKKHGTVFASFSRCLLMESTPDILYTIKEYNIDIDYLELEPFYVSHSNTITSANLRPVVKDPLIEEMVKKVNKDSVEKFLRELCAFHNRDATKRWNREELIPYMKEKFLAYGCDSIIEIPVENGKYAPVVAGVRFGKKDNTIKKFCMIGGHNDTKLSDNPDGRHQGAWDNGSGAVHFLEAARVMQDYDFDYSIIFAGLNAEEYGLRGSAAMVKEFKDNDLKVIGGVFTNDMSGIRGAIAVHRIYEKIEGAQEFHDKILEIVDTYETFHNVQIVMSDSPNEATDSKSFWNGGYMCANGWGWNENGTQSGCGTGSPHSAKDTIPPDFDPTFLTGTIKTPIAVTAFYAVPSLPTEISQGVLKPNIVKQISIINQKNGCVLIIITLTRQESLHYIELFTIKGRRILSVKPHQYKSDRFTVTLKDNMFTNQLAAQLLLVKYKLDKLSGVEKIVVK